MKEDWTYKKLEEVCSLITKGTTPTSLGFDFTEQGVAFVKIESLTEDGGILPSMVAHISDDCNNALKRSQLEELDILYSIAGALGRVAIVPKSILPANTNQALAIIRLRNKEIGFIRFLKYFLTSRPMLSAIMNLKVGVAQQNLSLTQIRDLTIPIPPITEQSRIVSELDLLQSIIDKQKAQLKELDNLAQAVFYDMFGDPVENDNGWEVKKLEEIVSDECPISYGIVQPGDGVENGIPVVRPVDMTHTFVYRQGLKHTTKEISNSYKRTILKGNEILLCVRGTTGLVSLATDELKGCNVNRGVTPIECNAQNDRWFVYFQFLTNAIQLHIAEYTKGIALKQINMKDVREIPFIVPPLSLQQSFAAKIESIEKQKAAITQSIAETQRLFDYTMDKYFG